MARVEIARQPWGYLESGGNPLPSTTAILKNLDGTNATHWSAITGGSSSTSSLTSDAAGLLPRYVEEDTYTLTVGATTGTVEATVGKAGRRIQQATGGVLIYGDASAAAGSVGTVDVRSNEADAYSAIQFNAKKDLIDTSAEFWRQKINWTTPQTGWGTAQIGRPLYLRVDHLATDATPTQNVSNGVYSLLVIGQTTPSSIAAKGTSHAVSAGVAVRNSGDAGNERCAYFGYIRNDTSATPGRDWLFDLGLHGAIATQQSYLAGITMITNNFYNGAPTSAPADAIVVGTKGNSGAGLDSSQLHWGQTTYPMDNGLHVIGMTGVPGSEAAQGFHQGIKVGGTGSGWSIAGSRFGTAIEILDWETYGLRVSDRHSAGDSANASAVSIASGAGGVCIGEDAPPSAATNLLNVRALAGTSDPVAIFRGNATTDSISVRVQNGSGIMSLFATGAAGGFLTGTAAGDTGISPLTAGKQFHIGGSTKVVTVTQDNKLGLFAVTPVARPTGWTAATGTATRTTFATSTVTLPVLAEHVKALIDDLLSLGAIGP